MSYHCEYNYKITGSYLPVSKNSRPKNLKKTQGSKKLKAHFQQSNQGIGVNLRFKLKKVIEGQSLRDLLLNIKISEDFG